MTPPGPDAPASPSISAVTPSGGELSAAVRWTRWIALATCLLLIILCVAWEGHLAPIGRHTLVLKALPLMLAWTGLRRERLYTYRWLSLAVWLYVAEAGMRIGQESPRVTALAVTEMVLALALFAACAAHIRLRLAAGRRLAALKSPPTDPRPH